MKLTVNLKRLFTLLFFCFLLFLPGAFAQDFSLIDRDLTTLENLILDTILNTEEQQRLLEDLKKNLDESGSLITNYESIITTQENLLKELQTHLNEMSEIYRTQSVLSSKYEQTSKFWRTFTIIAIPAAALISGCIVGAASR